MADAYRDLFKDMLEIFNGKKIKNAFITVYHNGILIHDNVELKGPTPGGVSDQESPKGVLMLQDHGDTVRYRNIWYKPAE